MLKREQLVLVERGDHVQTELEVLFCDIRRFTTILEGMPPQEAFAFINSYLTRLVWPVIGQYSRDRRVPNVSLDNISFHFAERRIDATAVRQPLFAVAAQ